MKRYQYLILSAAMLISVSSAKAAAMDQELQQLREDIQILQRQIYRNNETSEKAASAETSLVHGKIGEYDETIRKINGRMDELENNLKQTNNRLDKINRDMEIRFKILEGRQIPAELSAPAPKIAPTYSVPVAQGASKAVTGESIQGNDLPPLDGQPQPLIQENFPTQDEPSKSSTIINANTPDEMYKNAMQAYNSGLYDEAELAFEDILKQFPQHNLAGNAQFWLGEVYTKQGNLDKAKAAFKDGYEKYKNGNKAADSLFKLGNTFKQSGDKNRACIVYMSFGEEFPKASADLVSKVKAEINKLGCK